ncbi:MAG TPA: FAD-binding oxidoreductase [Candidatus Dormibacteraeota bacterium]|nr:FAD-binding oxidoreductase [Candidatus Dormibacteraeota bacterium]
MPDSTAKLGWGKPPWTIDFRPSRQPMPGEVDIAVVGGGFTGLSAAAWLRRIAPEKSVALLEAGTIGAGSSGHSGGMVLAETAAGDLPGLGDVLAGYTRLLQELAVDCDLTLPGVWEVGRSGGLPDSPISWADSGNVRALQQVPGGMIDPAKFVSEMARVAETSGAQIFENTGVDGIEFEDPLLLHVQGGTIRAKRALLATNAMSLELGELALRAHPKFTLAVATEPLSGAQLDALGLASGKPFYTVDFPYLWGRGLRTGGMVFGAGLVDLDDWRELSNLDIAAGESAGFIARLEARVRGLHPCMQGVRFSHRWGGPILIADHWRPVFCKHPQSPNAVVLGAYSGHGVALSAYLGCWAAEALCDRRALPNWIFPNSTDEGR